MKAIFEQLYNDQQNTKLSSIAEFCRKLETGQSGKYNFEYSSDFDENGILFFLGSNGNQNKWENPALTGDVCVSSSTLGGKCKISSLVGRETVRLVTTQAANTWMQVDFMDKLIEPSYYSLKHYSTYDNECLRNWILQASNDGKIWVTIKRHVADTSLSGKGSTYTWPILSQGKYRIWRIKQTGMNCNRHTYLACSGIEFYGQLFLTEYDALNGVMNRIKCEAMMKSLGLIHKSVFEENNDKNGVLYYIGTCGGTSEWVNPASQNWIFTDASSLMSDSASCDVICGRETVRCVTKAVPDSWMKIELINLFVVPTYYSLRHYNSWDTETLRNWVLEASFDGDFWRILKRHINDESLKGKGCVATWRLNAKGAKYRYFRIKQTALNSNGHYYLACSGFEIYGEIYKSFVQPISTDYVEDNDMKVSIDELKEIVNDKESLEEEKKNENELKQRTIDKIGETEIYDKQLEIATENIISSLTDDEFNRLKQLLANNAK
eukprot:378710_1